MLHDHHKALFIISQHIPDGISDYRSDHMRKLPVDADARPHKRAIQALSYVDIEAHSNPLKKKKQ